MDDGTCLSQVNSLKEPGLHSTVALTAFVTNHRLLLLTTCPNRFSVFGFSVFRKNQKSLKPETNERNGWMDLQYTSQRARGWMTMIDF